MRKLDCECGHTLEAQNDDELFGEARKHIAEVHPDMSLSDDEVRGLISSQAYDA
jgi:predicted small metal-binding protein